MRTFIILLSLVCGLNFAFASESSSSWKSLGGKFQAEGQAGCAEHINIYYQDFFGTPQLFGYDLGKPAGENRIFIFAEGEWVSGSGPDERYHTSYEIKNNQGHYFSNIISDSSGQIHSHITIRVDVELEGVVDAFYLRNIDYKSQTQSTCLYLKEE